MMKHENSELKLRENYQATQIKKLENEIEQLELQKDKLERQGKDKEQELEQQASKHRDAIFEKEK
jgi:hypothetical protein